MAVMIESLIGILLFTVLIVSLTLNIVNIIFTKNVNLKITRNVNLLLPVLLTYVYLFRPFLVFQHIHKILGSI